MQTIISFHIRVAWSSRQCMFAILSLTVYHFPYKWYIERWINQFYFFFNFNFTFEKKTCVLFYSSALTVNSNSPTILHKPFFLTKSSNENCPLPPTLFKNSWTFSCLVDSNSINWYRWTPEPFGGLGPIYSENWR